jgi:hypothetical protein
MLDLLNKSENETAIDTVTKRERIETELRADPNRSDRKIASVVGCDHKTVGSARDRLGLLPHWGIPHRRRLNSGACSSRAARTSTRDIRRGLPRCGLLKRRSTTQLPRARSAIRLPAPVM